MVATTVNNSIDELKGAMVESIEPGNARLHLIYSILVRHYAMDADLYNYWKLMKDVNENSGGMYSRIPAPIFGHITCCDGKVKALGYFAASSLREKCHLSTELIIMLKRSTLTRAAPTLPKACCRWCRKFTLAIM